jgi:hypothetical protein
LKERRSIDIVNDALLANLLNILLFVSFLSIALRAFSLYIQIRSPRLFILGLSLGVIACTAAADFVSGIVTNISLNTDWFLFLGQAVGFAFIFLSLVRGSNEFLRRLLFWQVICMPLAFFLLLLAPVLPDFPNTAIRAILSGSRCMVCFLIFGCYAYAFMSKKTRFSLLMSGAFLLLSVGYSLILPKYFFPQQDILDQVGDVVRIIGLVILLVAYLWG